MEDWRVVSSEVTGRVMGVERMGVRRRERGRRDWVVLLVEVWREMGMFTDGD